MSAARPDWIASFLAPIGRSIPLALVALLAAQVSMAARVVDWQATGPTVGGWQIERWGDVREASIAINEAPGSSGSAMLARLVSVDAKPPSAQLIHPVAFVGGRVYRVTMELAASQPVDAAVSLRVRPAPYETVNVRTIRLSPQWQTVQLDAAWPLPTVLGDVRVGIDQPVVDFRVRRLVVEDLGALPIGRRGATIVAPTLFGLHVNKLGEHFTWPEFNPGLVRLWDTGTNWHDLAPSPESFDAVANAGWQRLDLYVNFIRRQNADAAILYTLGQPPRWASDLPDAKCAYGQGTCGGPKSMAIWRHYVHTVALRYKGRIRHWELWNEPDNHEFYQSGQSLAALARAAREELKAVDARNQLIAPGFTKFGLRELSAFLRDGGGDHVDGIAYHMYFNAQPEQLATLIFNLREIMKLHGVGEMPIWNTEGSPLCAARIAGRCELDRLTDEEQDALTPRAILTMFLSGVEAFAYYDLEGMGGQTLSLLSRDNRQSSKAGTQLALFKTWLVGATADLSADSSTGVHALKVRRNGEARHIVWSQTANADFEVPLDWPVSRYQVLGGAPVAIPQDRRLRVGRVPMLISSARSSDCL